MSPVCSCPSLLDPVAVFEAERCVVEGGAVGFFCCCCLLFGPASGVASQGPRFPRRFSVPVEVPVNGASGVVFAEAAVLIKSADKSPKFINKVLMMRYSLGCQFAIAIHCHHISEGSA